MSQSKKGSIWESIINTGTFFIVAALFQYFIMFPATGAQVDIWESLGWSSVYTGGAILWQYMWRRIFDK